MASSSLGLAEARGEGKVVKSVSSSEEKLLYVFVWHQGASDYLYSLFALRIPSRGSIVEVETKTALNAVVKGIRNPIIKEPKRSFATPVLRFPANEGWPNNMRCICLDRKLYFLGGQKAGMGAHSKEVYVLDVDDPTRALKPVSSMNSGKSNSFVSFVADGMIYVVCGRQQCPHTGVPFTRFEIFRPSVGVWNVPEDQPPFPHTLYLYPPIVSDRTVFFAGEISAGKKFTCVYNIDTGLWSNYCGPLNYFTPSVREMVLVGGMAVGETLWTVFDDPKTQKPAVVRMDLAPLMGENKKFFGDVLRYSIPDQEDEGLGLRHPAARLLTRGPLSSCMCFLQLEPSNGLVDGQNRMSAQLFDVHGSSAGYLTSGHYIVLNRPHNYDKLMDAHLV